MGWCVISRTVISEVYIFRFVLLKEKNMLLTMEHACDEEYHIFPNPERIDKVQAQRELVLHDLFP